MATRIDEDRSPESVTVVRGDTAMLVCTVINIGDKSVGITLIYGTVLVFSRDKSVGITLFNGTVLVFSFLSFRQKNVECMIQNGTQFIDRLKIFLFFYFHKFVSLF